jgi:hypothetical protein
MTNRWKQATGRFLVRRHDDHEIFELLKVSFFREEQIASGTAVVEEPFKTFESVDGRLASTQDEKTFYFDDESWRTMQRITPMQSD